MLEVLSTPIGAAYTAVFFASGLACLLLIPRARTFDDPEIRAGLVWLLATTGAWGVLKTAFLLLPTPLRGPSYILGLVAGFATVWAWLYFCSAYTGRSFHRDRTLRQVGAATLLAVVTAKLTNPLHGLYFTSSEATSPFPHLSIDHGLLHWSATGLSYVLAAVGLFMVFELYFRSEYDTRPLGGLAVLLGLPIIFDIIAVSTPRLINFIYAPIGVAIFATGVLFIFRERLLAVRTALPGGSASIYLDDDQRIRDTSTAATELFPVLERATGEPLAEVLPELAAFLDSDESVLELQDNDSSRPEREGTDDSRYYFVESNPVGLTDAATRVVTFTDVTRLERKRRQLRRRERELDEQNELYRAVLAASFDFVFRTDPDGYLTFVSPSVEDVLGYAAEELVDEPVDTLAPTDEIGEQIRKYSNDVLQGESLQIRELQLEHRDGKDVYADVRVVPIYDPSVPEAERTTEDIVGAQGMIHETTDRHRREGLISVINRVLRHNVRNKLTVINGYAEMLSTDLEGQAAANADRIVETADRLLDLTESARKIEQARDQSPELESHDIIPILEETVTRIEEQYPTVSIATDTPESAVVLTLPRVETAFFELLDNAAKHGGDAPSITVDVRVGAELVAVTVRDDGPGLPENEREVLEAGVEDPLAHGSGLGLWLAYWIVTTMDGDVTVVDTDGGTAVELTLPKAGTQREDG